jgi:uncharacterized phage-associated protein
MPYEAIAVANYLIERAQRDGEALTPMKVQKLVYFAHGWNLALNDQPLINERVQAWKFGPVVAMLYQELKAFGSGPIPGPIKVLRFDGARVFLASPTLQESPDYSPDVEKLLDRVWEIYGKYSAIKLSNATHAPGSPWEQTWKAANGASHKVIDDDLIRQDFLNRAKRTSESAPAIGAAHTA